MDKDARVAVEERLIRELQCPWWVEPGQLAKPGAGQDTDPIPFK